MKDHQSTVARCRLVIPVTIFFALLPFLLRAQDKPAFARIDSLSYKAYLDSDWKKVLEYAGSGFKNGYDYYYLRMRAGIAEFNLHRPVQATNHFRKALKFSLNDPLVLEYLYASCLLSGDQAESRLLASDYSHVFHKNLGIPARRLITGIFIEPGYLVNPKATELQDFRPDAELAHTYLIPSYWYVAAGASLEAGKRFSATLAANIMSFKATQQFQPRNLDPVVFEVPYEQRSIYLAGSYYFGRGFYAGLAGQMMTYTLPLYRWVAGQTGGEYILGAGDWRDLALNASVTKRFPYVTAALSADAVRIKGNWYRQAGAGLTLYPTGSINTYLGATGTWQADSLKRPGKLVTHAFAGRKLFRNMWLEGDYYFGEIRNFSESNAYVVYNNYDIIRKRMGLSLLAYRVRPHLDLAFRYQHTVRTATWQIYKNSQYIRDQQKEYPVNSFIVGITWRF
jgi:hypothetical protein